MNYYIITSTFFLTFILINTTRSTVFSNRSYDLSYCFGVFLEWWSGLGAIISLILGILHSIVKHDPPILIGVALIIIVTLCSIIKSIIPGFAKEALVREYREGSWDGSMRFYFFRWYRITKSILETSDTFLFVNAICVDVPDLCDFNKVIFSTDYPFEICKMVPVVRRHGDVHYVINNTRFHNWEDFFFICPADNGGIYAGEVGRDGRIYAIVRYEKGVLMNRIPIKILNAFNYREAIPVDYFCKPRFARWSQEKHADNGISCFDSVGNYFIIDNCLTAKADIYDCRKNFRILVLDDVNHVIVNRSYLWNDPRFDISIILNNGMSHHISR